MEIHPEFQKRLDYYNESRNVSSPFFVKWNERKQRWVIYVDLRDNSNPEATPERLDSITEWDSERGKVVKFATYQLEDGTFMPLDDRLFAYLDSCDTRYDKHDYDQRFESEEDRQKKVDKIVEAISADQASYTHNFDNPIFGFGHGGGDWRWRIR